ncbi:hypothetical protein [Aequorivita sediminis]|uniref:hypothetical protein n=1 Tax=Aequorivita sediminis TaxID=3073653 RepID=UPI0028A6CE7F|nr:hypothetical protein [Aequorivita sp. F6058]
MSFYKNVIYIIFLTVTICYGKNEQDFRDGTNYSHILSIADTDLDKAVKIANSLFLNAKTSSELIEAKMISSVI